MYAILDFLSAVGLNADPTEKSFVCVGGGGGGERGWGGGGGGGGGEGAKNENGKVAPHPKKKLYPFCVMLIQTRTVGVWNFISVARKGIVWHVRTGKSLTSFYTHADR